jgi:hypothetical protein
VNGTGLEDYVCTAWGLGQHWGHFAGAPLVLPSQRQQERSTGMITGAGLPEFVSMYRWHYHDPIWFSDSLRVTVQQIGLNMFEAGEVDAARQHAEQRPPAASWWWLESDGETPIGGLTERIDDYCATAFVYGEEPQSVPRVDVTLATRDVEFRAAESEEHEERLDLIRRVSKRMFGLAEPYEEEEVPRPPRG